MDGNRGTDIHLIGANGSGPSGRDRQTDSLASGTQDDVDLRDKVALIVAGASGDSQALALAFARRGMHIVLLSFHDEHQTAAAIKEQVEGQKRRCLLISWRDHGEANERRFAERAMQQIRETFGRLDVFVNLGPPPRHQNGDSVPAEQKPDLRARLFPHLKIMKAALNQIAESDPD